MNWIARHRQLVLALICAIWTGAVVLALLYPDWPFLSAVARGEQSFQDLLRREGQKTPTRDDFIFIGIDQQSLQLDVLSDDEIAASRPLQLMTERPYPWSREVWALLLDQLFGAGARLVIFDMMFNPPNDGDPAFAAALERYRDRVVLGSNFNQDMGALIGPNATLIPPPPDQDDRVGLVNFWPDPADGEVRSARYLVTERQLAGQEPVPGDTTFSSLAARALVKLGRGGNVPHDFKPHVLRFSAPDAYPPHPLWQIFFPKTWASNYAGGAFLQDKIVIVGASAPVMHDVVNTPLAANMFGPAVHLNAISAALAHQFLRAPPPLVGYASLTLAGLSAWSLIAFLRKPVVALLTLVGLTLTLLLLARYLYDTRGLLLLTVPVLIAFIGSGASALGLDYALERREKIKTRRALERYVSRNLVQEILDNPASYYNSMRGVRKPATMLFSDIVGFTSLTERADPIQLVAQLNEYLTRMVAVVFENDGTLDKFIGDAVMAVWGNVHSRGVVEDAKAAARTAIGMRRELVTLNERWRREGFVPLAIGVGINQGDVLIGNIGSSGSHERLDPTVIGDSVNLASRLEALTRAYGVDILVGPTASELIRDAFHLRSVARVQVKGKSDPVDITTLIGARDEEVNAKGLRSLEIHEEGIRRFRAREFKKAAGLFAQFIELHPNDQLAKMYVERAIEFERHPPGDSWNAADVFTKK